MEAQQNAEGRGGASLESAEGGGEALRKRLERRVGGNGGFRTSPEAVNTQMPKRVSGKGPRETWAGRARPRLWTLTAEAGRTHGIFQRRGGCTKH